MWRYYDSIRAGNSITDAFRNNQQSHLAAFGGRYLDRSAKLLVEFSSPNIAKPFHAGHLRSTLLGRFVVEILRAAGHPTISVNYLGDWGTQFGILAKGFAEFGDVQMLKGSPSNAIGHLYDVYVRANQLAEEDEAFRAEATQLSREIEEGEERALDFWRSSKRISVWEFQRLYDRLRVSFDHWDGEAVHADSSRLLLSRWEREGKLVRSEGALGVTDGNRFIMLSKTDGCSLYLSRDLAAVIDRQERFCPDLILYVVDDCQREHFVNLQCALNCLGYPHLAAKVVHVPFGRIGRMSSRKGNAVFVEELLKAGAAKTLEAIRSANTTKIGEAEFASIAEELALSALVTNDLKHRRTSQYRFDWDACLKTTGDTGVNLQYSHARLCSLLSVAAEQFGPLDRMDLSRYEDSVSLVEPEALLLWHHVQKLDAVLTETYLNLEPAKLISYLFRLSRLIGKANRRLRVRGQTEGVALGRILLFSVARHLLADNLRLLGLRPLEKM